MDVRKETPENFDASSVSDGKTGFEKKKIHKIGWCKPWQRNGLHVCSSRYEDKCIESVRKQLGDKKKNTRKIL